MLYVEFKMIYLQVNDKLAISTYPRYVDLNIVCCCFFLKSTYLLWSKIWKTFIDLGKKTEKNNFVVMKKMLQY